MNLSMLWFEATWSPLPWADLFVRWCSWQHTREATPPKWQQIYGFCVTKASEPQALQNDQDNFWPGRPICRRDFGGFCWGCLAGSFREDFAGAFLEDLFVAFSSQIWGKNLAAQPTKHAWWHKTVRKEIRIARRWTLIFCMMAGWHDHDHAWPESFW